MAMIAFLERLPLWLLALVLNASLMGSALVGLWIFSRHVLPRLHLNLHNAYYVAPLMQESMLLYSLVAALTAVGVWTRYSDVSRVVSAEATAITTLWRDLDGYPEPLAGSMRDVLRGYTDQVIHNAWPQLKQGQIPSEGVEWMNRLQSLLYAFEPATEGQKVLHAETLREFNHLVEERRQRLDAAQGSLPGVIWFVLLGGAVAGITLGQFFYVETARLKACMLLGLAASLAMVLLVIFALDTPFTGDMSIGPESYQLIYDQHMTGGSAPTR
jgi:Protein of unknown function (DUF4239)